MNRHPAKIKLPFGALVILSFGAIALFNSCSKKEDKVDKEKPTITINYTDGFPQACSQLKRGHTYAIRALTADNLALASYSIDIHNNFDHHTHDNQEEECELGAMKAPVNPWVFMEHYPIEGNKTTYEIVQEISIPETIDTGDYHFHISVTDVTGWQGRAFVDIKIVQ